MSEIEEVCVKEWDTEIQQMTVRKGGREGGRKGGRKGGREGDMGR